MRVLVVCESAARAEIVREAFEVAGHEVAASPLLLLKTIERVVPELIVIDTDSPSRQTLQQVAAVSEHAPRPVVVFAADRAPETARHAMRAGVTVYRVGGLDASRIGGVLDLAVARFAERRLIARAKGVVMKTSGLDEDAAYAWMRKAAMDRKIRLAKVAELLVHEAV